MMEWGEGEWGEGHVDAGEWTRAVVDLLLSGLSARVEQSVAITRTSPKCTCFPVLASLPALGSDGTEDEVERDFGGGDVGLSGECGEKMSG